MSRKLVAVAVCAAMLTVARVDVALATVQDDSPSGESRAGWDRVTDIVVIGAGTAGVPAAVAAYEKGCRSIVLLEKTATIGGTAALSQGLMAGYGTRIAKRLGVHVASQEMYDMVMRHADYRVDPDLMRITVDKSGEAIDWLMETMGVPYKEEINVGYGPLRMMHVVEGRGAGMARAYKAALERRGIEVLRQTPARELLIDDDGSVVGVLAVNKDGNELRIRSKAVIIATGGYAGSNTLAGLLNPLYEGAFGVGNGAANGDGLIMASRIGASISNTGLLMGVLKDYEILSKHRGNIYSSSIARFAEKCIYIGKAGRRFVAERDASFMSGGDRARSQADTQRQGELRLGRERSQEHRGIQGEAGP